MPPPHLLKHGLDMRFGEECRQEQWTNVSLQRPPDDAAASSSSSRPAEDDDMFDDDDYGIVVDGDMDDDEMEERDETDDRSSKTDEAEDASVSDSQTSGAQLSAESKTDEEVHGNSECTDAPLEAADAGLKQELPLDGVSSPKSSRKRKNKNPTRFMVSSHKEGGTSVEDGSLCDETFDSAAGNEASSERNDNGTMTTQVKTEPMEEEEKGSSKEDWQERHSGEGTPHCESVRTDGTGFESSGNVDDQCWEQNDEATSVKTEPDFQSVSCRTIKREFPEQVLPAMDQGAGGYYYHRQTSDPSFSVGSALQQLECLSQRQFSGPQYPQHGASHQSPSSAAPSASPSGSSKDSSGGCDDCCLPEVDPENPRRCPVCGDVLADVFAVRAHMQSAHMRLIHACSFQGCKAAFPSRRSRDRHSDNLKMHRRLLSAPHSDAAVSASAAAAALFADMMAYNDAANEVFAKQCQSRSADM